MFHQPALAGRVRECFRFPPRLRFRSSDLVSLVDVDVVDEVLNLLQTLVLPMRFKVRLMSDGFTCQLTTILVTKALLTSAPPPPPPPIPMMRYFGLRAFLLLALPVVMLLPVLMMLVWLSDKLTGAVCVKAPCSTL